MKTYMFSFTYLLNFVDHGTGTDRQTDEQQRVSNKVPLGAELKKKLGTLFYSLQRSVGASYPPCYAYDVRLIVLVHSYENRRPGTSLDDEIINLT